LLRDKDTRKRVALVEKHFPCGWWAVDPYSPERSRRNGFGFMFVFVI